MPPSRWTVDQPYSRRRESRRASKPSVVAGAPSTAVAIGQKASSASARDSGGERAPVARARDACLPSPQTSAAMEPRRAHPTRAVGTPGVNRPPLPVYDVESDSDTEGSPLRYSTAQSRVARPLPPRSEENANSQDLTRALDRLSLGGGAAPPSPPSIPPVADRAPERPPPPFNMGAKKFYVVTKGRRCGVYSDWYVP